MAININNKQNVTPAGGDFEFAKIKDETTPGANDGVPVNDNVYGDFHQFFAKIIEQALITYNDLPENLTNGYQYLEALKKLFVQTEPGKQLNTKVIDIGDWDMDANGTVAVAHGLSDITKIRNISLTIRNDSGVLIFPWLLATTTAAGNPTAFGIEVGLTTPFPVDVTNINLSREDSGVYDDIAFNATSFNRGWITVQFVD